MVYISSTQTVFTPPNGVPAVYCTAMRGGCSVLMLCTVAMAVITLGLGIMSVGFPESSAALRSTILTNILLSSSYTNHPNIAQSQFVEKPALVDDQNPSSQIAGECDLWRGRWIEDEQRKPLYTHESCPVLTATQNCESNGRPDKGYVKWRWRPDACELPLFDVNLFFCLLRGKTLAFVGDSVARNHMESLMCMLWQAEVPENKGSKRMQRWYFRSKSVTIIRIWSSWLVDITNDAYEFAPQSLTKLLLEQADNSFMEFLPRLDVLVISSGHWFSKKTAYVSQSRLVGGQLWSDKRIPAPRMRNPDAFALAMKTALKAITSHPLYKGLTILRSYSPDHYEGGAWNAGGSCTGKTRPSNDSELVTNGYTNLMRRHQLNAFSSAQHNITNGSKLRLLDVTPVFAYRGDGHPGPYRSQDPNKITKRGPHGEPPPQDCLHWCMPGPVDTWNELLLEIIRQEFGR